MFRKIKSKINSNRIQKENKEKAIQIMKANYLSPKQIENILNNGFDIDMLSSVIEEAMDYPDVDYLAEVLTPVYRVKNKKDISNREIVKASILGDIIGSHYEFTPHNYLYTSTIEELPHKYSQYTDDTVLSIATMNAILENDKKPDFRRAYIEAYNEYPNVGYGGSFVNWAMGDNMFYVEGVASEKIDNSKGYHSIGNGCTMRLSFIPAYYDDIQDVIKHTIESVMVTHDHVESIKGSVVFSVCIWMAFNGYTKDEIYEYYKRHYNEDIIEKSVYQWCQYNQINRGNYFTSQEKKTTLYVPFAVPVVIEAFYQTKSYKDCMRKILSHFGDTDTLCAMAGGLCYAFYSETMFPTNEILKKFNVPVFT